MFLVCKYSGQQQSPFNTLFNYVLKVRPTQVSVLPQNRHVVSLLSYYSNPAFLRRLSLHSLLSGSRSFHSGLCTDCFIKGLQGQLLSHNAHSCHIYSSLIVSHVLFQKQPFHLCAYPAGGRRVRRVHPRGVWLLQGDGHYFNQPLGALCPAAHQDLHILPLHQNRPRFFSMF